MYIKITYITLHANMWIDIDPTVCQGDDRFSHVTGSSFSFRNKGRATVTEVEVPDSIRRHSS